MVIASTRLPASTRPATPPVVWSSSSSISNPIRRSRWPSSRREVVVELVTNRRRWPAARRPRTASIAPGIGLPDTCSTPSTSRRMAAMDAECIRSEVRFRFSRSSGPGGQHAQKTSTRVEALFDVARLGRAARERAPARPGALGPIVRAVAQDERSQLQNRERARERVLEQVAEAARPRAPRRPTRPSLRRASAGSRKAPARASASGCGGRPRPEPGPLLSWPGAAAPRRRPAAPRAPRPAWAWRSGSPARRRSRARAAAAPGRRARLPRRCTASPGSG